MFLFGTLYTLAFYKEINNTFIIYNFISCVIGMIFGLITFLKPEMYIKSFCYENIFKYKALLVRFFGITCFIMGVFAFYIILIDK